MNPLIFCMCMYNFVSVLHHALYLCCFWDVLYFRVDGIYGGFMLCWLKMEIQYFINGIVALYVIFVSAMGKLFVLIVLVLVFTQYSQSQISTQRSPYFSVTPSTSTPPAPPAPPTTTLPSIPKPITTPTQPVSPPNLNPSAGSSTPTPTSGFNNLDLDNQLTKLSDLLKTGNSSEIIAIFSKVFTNNTISCDLIWSFVSKASQKLKQQIAQNQYQLSTLQTDTSSQVRDLNNKRQLQKMLTKIKDGLSINSTQIQFLKLQAERKNYQAAYQQANKDIAAYLQDIRDLKEKNGIITLAVKEEEAINKLEIQLKSTENFIQNLQAKRMEMYKNLTEVKLSLLYKEISARERTSATDLENQYKRYSQLAIQSKQKATQKAQQISDLQSIIRKKLSTKTSYDDEIDQVVAKLQAKNSEETENGLNLLKTINGVLDDNLKKIQGKIGIVDGGCTVLG